MHLTIYIFPISAVMQKDKARYDQTLEAFSKTIMPFLVIQLTPPGRALFDASLVGGRLYEAETDHLLSKCIDVLFVSVLADPHCHYKNDNGLGLYPVKNSISLPCGTHTAVSPQLPMQFFALFIRILAQLIDPFLNELVDTSVSHASDHFKGRRRDPDRVGQALSSFLALSHGIVLPSRVSLMLWRKDFINSSSPMISMVS